MDVKFGKIKPNSESFDVSLENSSEENFFMISQEVKFTEKEKKQVNGKRLNDYDSNILEKNAYQGLSDESLKIEHKISFLEESLININNEIKIFENLGHNAQIYNLKDQKQKIEKEIKELNKKYSDLGFSAKISNKIARLINFTSNKQFNILFRVENFLSKKILTKLSKKFSETQIMKETLNNLNDINSGVDELIQMQIPYGETVNRYEKLTTYLNQANKLHSKISKNINQISTKKA